MRRIRRSVLVTAIRSRILRFWIEIAHDAGGEQAEGSADAGQRCAEFMGDGGDKLVFEGVELGALGELELILLPDLIGLLQLLDQIVAVTFGLHKHDEQRDTCE